MDPHLNLLGPREQDRQRRVVEAELRRLVRELRGCGPMTRQQLADLCGAAHRREGSFEAAVRRGIDDGVLGLTACDRRPAMHGKDLCLLAPAERESEVTGRVLSP